MTRLKDAIAEMASFVAAIEEGFEAQDSALTDTTPAPDPAPEPADAPAQEAAPADPAADAAWARTHRL